MPAGRPIYAVILCLYLDTADVFLLLNTLVTGMQMIMSSVFKVTSLLSPHSVVSQRLTFQQANKLGEPTN